MKMQLILEIKDEVYPYILYVLKYIEGVEIVEDIYIEEKTETLHKDENR